MAFASLVRTTHVVLGTALMGSALTLAAACSSTTNTGTGDGGTAGTSGGTSGATSGGTSGGTSGATSGGTSGATSGGMSSGGVVGGGKCGTSGTSTCTQAETDSYNSCLTTMCDAQYQAALGSGYKTGSFGGACGTYITCTQACACNDTACYMKCGQPDMACTTALTNSSTCAMSKCPPPSCLSGGKDGGTSGTSGGTMHTCADLMACCAAISDANNKASCDAALMAAGSTDSTCSAYYSAFKMYCP